MADAKRWPVPSSVRNLILWSYRMENMWDQCGWPVPEKQAVLFSWIPCCLLAIHGQEPVCKILETRWKFLDWASGGQAWVDSPRLMEDVDGSWILSRRSFRTPYFPVEDLGWISWVGHNIFQIWNKDFWYHERSLKCIQNGRYPSPPSKTPVFFSDPVLGPDDYNLMGGWDSLGGSFQINFGYPV